MWELLRIRSIRNNEYPANFPLRHAEQHSQGGGFRRGLSERSEFRSRQAWRAAQGIPERDVVRGVFFFHRFLLDKQKKSVRQSGETDNKKAGNRRLFEHSIPN